MLWIILLLLILIPAWALLTPLELKIDTRVPMIIIKWKSIGNATFVYEGENWLLKIRILFFSKQWNLEQMIFAEKKKKKAPIRRKNTKRKKPVLKFLKVLKTFRIVQWEIAVSTDDDTQNARWYWLNYFPLTRHHVRINFIDENYLVLIIKNNLW